MLIDRTPRLSLGSRLACLMLCVIAAIPAPIGAAQDSPPSVSELRRENERLRVRIDELEAQLTRSQEAIESLLSQVRELNARVADLQDQLRADHNATPGADNEAPRDDASPGAEEPSYAALPETERFAAPETLLREVHESYEENFGTIQTPFESADARARYLRDLDAWSKSLKRSLRSQVEWTIEVRRMISSDREPLTLEYRAVDPRTRRPYSNRVFMLTVPQRFARRVLQESAASYWQVRGVAGANLTINRERESVGFFDVRPFVGPYVEFGVDLTVSSILPVPEPDIAEGAPISAGDPDEPSEAADPDQ